MTSVREVMLPALEACAAESASTSATCVDGLKPPIVSLQAASISAVAANPAPVQMLFSVHFPVIARRPPRKRAKANAEQAPRSMIGDAISNIPADPARSPQAPAAKR